MSVRDISKEELQAIYRRCLNAGDVLRSYACLSPEQLAEALLCVHAANKAALAVTYGENVEIAPFDVTAGTAAADMNDRELFERLGNLCYNCVTNAGKCFLPPEQEQVILGVRLALARKALEQASREAKERR
jgi:hypothetical protein